MNERGNNVAGLRPTTWSLQPARRLWLPWPPLTSFASFPLRVVSLRWFEPPAPLSVFSPVGPRPVCPFALPARHCVACACNTHTHTHTLAKSMAENVLPFKGKHSICRITGLCVQLNGLAATTAAKTASMIMLNVHFQSEVWKHFLLQFFSIIYSTFPH